MRCRPGARSELTLGLFEPRQGLVDVGNAVLDLVELLLLVGGEESGLGPLTACRLGAERFQGVKLLLALPKQRVDLISQFHGSPLVEGG